MSSVRLAPITDPLHDQIGFWARIYFDAQQERIARGNRRYQRLKHDLGDDARALVESQAAADLAVERHAARRLVEWCRRHPLAPWVKKTRGLGLLGFGCLIGATGHLDNFANVAKLWAYLGMHVVNGRAPKRASTQRANWSHRGRMVCRQIGEAIVKARTGPYRYLYDQARKEYLARERGGESGCPFGQVHRDRSGKVLACVKPARLAGGQATDVDHGSCAAPETSAHVHAAALRKAVKALLRDMWVEWECRPLTREERDSKAS